jgi:hypothetical protein
MVANSNRLDTPSGSQQYNSQDALHHGQPTSHAARLLGVDGLQSKKASPPQAGLWGPQNPYFGACMLWPSTRFPAANGAAAASTHYLAQQPQEGKNVGATTNGQVQVSPLHVWRQQQRQHSDVVTGPQQIWQQAQQQAPLQQQRQYHPQSVASAPHPSVDSRIRQRHSSMSALPIAYTEEQCTTNMQFMNSLSTSNRYQAGIGSPNQTRPFA